MKRPRCWKCGSDEVTVTFVAYNPVFHKASECPTDCPGRLPGKSCGEVPSGSCACQACGNVWEDGDISEYEQAS